MDDSTKQLLTGLVRHALTIAGGYLAARGISVDDSTATALAGGLVALVGVVWSMLHKKGIVSA